MKLFHLSDLHLGIKLYNYDLKEDQQHILDQIVSYTKREKPDAILIAGDIYDKAAPAAEAVALLDSFISELLQASPQTAILAIAGNHDSGQRIACFGSILARQNVYMVGLPPQAENEHMATMTLQDEYGSVNFYMLPYVRPATVRAWLCPESETAISHDEAIHALLEREVINGEERNVLLSHQFYVPEDMSAGEVERADNEVFTVGNMDQVWASVLEPFDYVALGHIHKPTLVRGEYCRYCGTPMPYSVSEAEQEKGIVMVELGPKGSTQTRVLPLEPLRKVKVITGTIDEVLLQHCEDYVSLRITGEEGPIGENVRDRLRYAFPFLLDLRVERQYRLEETVEYMVEKRNPMEMCEAFLQDMSEEERRILEGILKEIEMEE